MKFYRGFSNQSTENDAFLTNPRHNPVKDVILILQYKIDSPEQKMKVTELMTTKVVTIDAGSTIEEAARIMITNGVSCLPVLDDSNKVVGIQTHTDFGFHKKYLPMADHLYTLMGAWVDPETLERVAKNVSSKIVKDVMIQPVITVQEDALVSDVADLMMNKRINRVPVMKDKTLIGIVTRHDFMKLMISENKLQ